MLTGPNIVFLIIAFILFVIMRESNISVEDSFALFIFTVVIFLMLIPRKNADEAAEARSTMDEYKEFLGKELVVNGFHCFVFKVKKSKNFAENSTCIVYGKHRMTGEKKAFGVNINEKSIQDFITEHQQREKR